MLPAPRINDVLHRVTLAAVWESPQESGSQAVGNIERASENAYRISVAVAGFTDADLSIETKENRLTIRGEKQTNDEEKTGDVLYQGIAARTFERSFQLADYVQVKGASLENGLLHVDLVREIPEAMKPRSIPIASSSTFLEVKPTKVAA
jgi:molecular chaperone IbpA